MCAENVSDVRRPYYKLKKLLGRRRRRRRQRCAIKAHREQRKTNNIMLIAKGFHCTRLPTHEPHLHCSDRPTTFKERLVTAGQEQRSRQLRRQIVSWAAGGGKSDLKARVAARRQRKLDHVLTHYQAGRTLGQLGR